METADIVGITCMVDRIVPDASIGEVHAGDTIAFPGAGAYQEPAASNFNALPRPGSLLVDGGQVHVIRRAESADDVFARDTVPVLAQAVGSEA
jgi:diaminopimelate decarboxylase